jgi:hypothetical protein
VPLSEDPIEELRAMCRIFTRWGLQNRTHYRLLMQPRDPDTTPPPAGEEARVLMQRPLEELERRGMIALGDLETARQSIWAYLHGLISLTSARPDVEWREDLLDQSLEALIRGWFDCDQKHRTTKPE